jgi:photosystem II stability/assembly factor-like uncharacterized protein
MATAMEHRHMVRVALVAGVGAAVLALSSGGCTADSGQPGVAAPLAGSAGSQLYATPAGVVWSFTPSDSLGQVARSSDGGRRWQVVLPGRGPHTGLAMSGSFFLGSDLGWVVHQYRRNEGLGENPVELATVLGTSDGGQHWWRSPPLVGAGLSDELDFTDARHGWLYGMGWTVEGDEDWQLTEGLWRTSDGGRTWAAVHARLPLQGTDDSADETCPDGTPWRIAFANQQDGWLTASSCAAIGSDPRVWRTTDGGQTWTSAPLPAPPGGWPSASDEPSGAEDVGIPWITASDGRADLLVAVADPAGLEIDASGDGGQSWHIDSEVHLDKRGFPETGWFEPVDASHWIVSAPGRVLQTSDAGHAWRVSSLAATLTGGPFWFTSLSRGYSRSSGGVTLATSDGGRTWSKGAAQPAASPVQGPAVTAVQELSPSFAIASGPAGLQVSRDGGRIWTPLPPVPGQHPLGAVQFLNSSTGFVIDDFGKQLWRTTDGGHSWTPIPEPPHVQVDHVQFWTPAEGAVVTRGFNPTGNGVYLTGTGGSTWRPLALPTGYWFNPADMPRLDYTCFAGGTGWFVGHPPRSIALGGTSVLVSTDAGVHWRPVLPPAVLRSGTVGAALGAWFGGCRGSTAWVEVRQDRYGHGGDSYDLLRTVDLGRTWQNVLHIQNGTAIPRLTLPLSPGALAPSPLPAGLALIPEPLALTSASGAWLTLTTPGKGLAVAVTADGGENWTMHWFPAPRHDPSTAPAAPSAFPAGLPWLTTTATDSGHAWVLFGSTNGSGASYLYATEDAGLTWKRIATFG